LNVILHRNRSRMTCILSFPIGVSKGFTLVELIITIILIAILATTVAPKFFTTESYQEYSYRADIINKLRAIQLIAMQQTSGSKCNQVAITAKSIKVADADCTLNNISVEVEENHDITFTGEESLITFDSSGRPDGDCRTNADGCDITITGTETLTIKIESEGYIHAQ
jgi:MSHA pilin protein MshC